WTKEQLLNALDQLHLPLVSEQGYPSLEDRRANVVRGFDDEKAHATVSGTVAEAVSETPTSANGTAEQHSAAGAQRLMAGDIDGAIKECRQAIELNPNLAGAHVNLGSALRDKGDLDGDINEEREAIRLQPGLSAAHVNLGAALIQKGDLEGASAEYR